MVMSRHQNTGQNHILLVTNKYVEDVAKFKIFWGIITNQNCNHNQIKSRLNLISACYCSVQNLLSSYLRTKWKTIILYVFCML